MEHPVHDSLFEDLQAAIAHYESKGDRNGLHYFRNAGEGRLDAMLQGAKVRFVPGAMVAIALYDHLNLAQVQAGEEPHGYAFSFQSPTLFYEGMDRLHVMEPSPPVHGVVGVERLDGTSFGELRWVKDDLYEKLGELWQTRGAQALERGEAAMVTAISVHGILPPAYQPKPKRGEIVEYRHGEIALRSMPLHVFERLMASCLATQPPQ